MSEQENTQTVREAYEAFQRGDIEGLLNTFSEDAEWSVPGPGDVIPHAGRRRGREQIAQYFATLSDVEEVQEFEPQEFIAQGDTVVVLGRYRGSAKATGRTIESDWVQAFTLRDGKIISFREYYDTAAVADAYRSDTTQTATTT